MDRISPLRGTSLSTLSAVLVAAVIAGAVPAQAQSGASARPWSLRVGLRGVYDTNILKYSEKYLGRFELREDEGRFHIGTSDDLILAPSLRLERSLTLLRRLPTVLSGEARFASYMRNGIKNWWSFTMGFRQQVPGRLNVAFTYAHIPDFYVRHYGDEDWLKVVGATPARFQAYAFAKDEYRTGVSWTVLTSSRLRVSYSALRYYHTRHFTEYNCRNGLWSFDVSHPLTDRIRLDAGYAYLVSDARGYDQPGESLGASDDVDGSFREDAYSFGASWRLPRVFGLDTRVAAAGEYSRRCFTTRHPIELDPLHAGRVDDEFLVSLGWTARLTARWEVALGYTWRLRDAWTRAEGNSAAVSDEKDYRQHQLEIGLTYAITF